jgi:hypothetical protein
METALERGEVAVLRAAFARNAQVIYSTGRWDAEAAAGPGRWPGRGGCARGAAPRVWRRHRAASYARTLPSRLVLRRRVPAAFVAGALAGVPAARGAGRGAGGLAAVRGDRLKAL